MDAEVYRAPMRSRLADVDAAAAVEWALGRGVVGVGAHGHVDEQPRIESRLQRFAGVAEGSFVWTRDGDGQPWLGRVIGPLRRDREGERHDLLHVRDCRWHRAPVPPDLVPAAVVQTFARGGRNFQRVNPTGVERQTARVWETLETST